MAVNQDDELTIWITSWEFRSTLGDLSWIQTLLVITQVFACCLVKTKNKPKRKQTPRMIFDKRYKDSHRQQIEKHSCCVRCLAMPDRPNEIAV